MFKVSDIITTPPAAFASELQRQVYATFAERGIPFGRVDTDPGLTMEDCQHIDAKIGVRIVKTIFVCNRQQTEFYLYVTTDDKPFVTRDFCGALGIPRVSFASAEKLWELTGVEVVCKKSKIRLENGNEMLYINYAPSNRRKVIWVSS